MLLKHARIYYLELTAFSIFSSITNENNIVLKAILIKITGYYLRVKTSSMLRGSKLMSNVSYPH